MCVEITTDPIEYWLATNIPCTVVSGKFPIEDFRNSEVVSVYLGNDGNL